MLRNTCLSAKFIIRSLNRVVKIKKEEELSRKSLSVKYCLLEIRVIPQLVISMISLVEIQAGK